MPSRPPALLPGRPAPAGAGRHRFRTGERICRGLVAGERLGGDDRIERWLAWSQHLWARVVVEVPCDEYADDLRTVRRLAREARVLRRLSHPAIPRLLEDAHDEPLPHLVLEHVEGETLDRVLAHGPLPPAAVADLGVRLAACLRHVHSRGLAHLRFEPSGIALRCDQPVLLHAGGVRDIRRSDPHLDLIALGELLQRLVAGAGGPSPRLDAALRALRGCRHDTVLDPVRLLAEALPGAPA